MTECIYDVKQFAWNTLMTTVDKKGYTYFERFLPQQKQVLTFNNMFDVEAMAQNGTCLRFKTTGSHLSFSCKKGDHMLRALKVIFQPTTFYQQYGKAVKRAHFKVSADKNKYSSKTILNPLELYIEGRLFAHTKYKNGKIEFFYPHPEKDEVEVCLALPHLRIGIRDFMLDGVVKPCEHNKKRLLCLGDSITSGGNTHHPNYSYVMQMANELDMEIINQGVSGNTFYVDCLNGLEYLDFAPDLITIAYGTNDWNFAPTVELVRQQMDRYFEKIEVLFENIPKVVITPIWRADEYVAAVTKELDEIRHMIERRAQKMKHTLVLNGSTLVPHDPGYYADGYLHPNDAGHAIYGANVAAKINEWLGNR